MNPIDITVRAAAPTDTTAMSALAYDAKKSNEHDDEILKRFADGLVITPTRLQTNRFWVAEKDAVVIGCIALEPLDRNRAEVRSFYVAPPYQGCGIGKRLLQELVITAMTQGITQLQAYADPRSVQKYKSFGFHLESIGPSRFSPEVTVPFMVRDI